MKQGRVADFYWLLVCWNRLRERTNMAQIKYDEHFFEDASQVFNENALDH